MSQIGRKPIEIPEKVQINLKDNFITVTGPLGEMPWTFDKRISVKVDESQLVVERSSDEKRHRELHGLTRAIINNMVVGVTEGFKIELQLVGVGYTAEVKENRFIVLNLGYSHPIIMEIPSGIKIETPNQTTIIVSGIDKQSVGQVAAKIRSFKKPEPYKGKGIKYSNEYIRRKAGKAIGATGA